MGAVTLARVVPCNSGNIRKESEVMERIPIHPLIPSIPRLKLGLRAASLFTQRKDGEDPAFPNCVETCLADTGGVI